MEAARDIDCVIRTGAGPYPPRMSPKKRRGPTPRRTTPAVVALREAQLLTEPGATRLAGELWASRHLGAGWAAAAPEEREPERRELAQLVAEAVRRSSPASAAALAACRLVLPDPSVDEALGRLGQPLPHWADAARPEPVRAWRSSDPWRSRDAWFLDFGDHLLLISVRHPGGTLVDELVVMGPESLAEFDRLARSEELIGERVEAPVPEAVREALAALEWTDLTWPREPSRSYADLRLLARARLAGLATDEDAVEGFPEGVREQLRSAFLAGETGEPEQRAVELFLDYGSAYLHDPLRWSPEDVAWFLRDWVPRKVVLDEAERAVLPAQLERWVGFALSRAGVEARWQEPVVAAVRQHAPALAGLALDDRAHDDPPLDDRAHDDRALDDPAHDDRARGATAGPQP